METIKTNIGNNDLFVYLAFISKFRNYENSAFRIMKNYEKFGFPEL